MGTIELYSKEKCPLDIKKCQLFAASVHFFAEVAHIGIKFSIQIYNIKSGLRLIIGTIKLFLTELCPLNKKNIVCSFLLFSSQRFAYIEMKSLDRF